MAVDALLGTGFQGEPHGALVEAIDAVNAAPAAVVSVDVPSGVDASTGEVCAGAVTAAATVTFHAAKPGLWIRPGKAYAGVVETIDIGIPRGAPQEAAIGLLDASVLGSAAAPAGVLDEVHERTRPRSWRLARAHGRAADGRAREHAHGRGVRHGMCARLAAGRSSRAPAPRR